jgi:Uma2 family endonuclease
MLPGYSRRMKPAMVHESILEERRQLGHDRFDEVWDGVIHMVPFPTTRHACVVTDLSNALDQIATRRGLRCFSQGIGIYPAGSPGHRNYRGPDCVVVDRKHLSDRGIEGHAALVVEVISPDDESRKKLSFYAAVGVREVWLVDPAKRSIEVLACDEGIAMTVDPQDGVVRSRSLAIDVSVEGSELRMLDGEHAYTVELDPRF